MSTASVAYYTEGTQDHLSSVDSAIARILGGPTPQIPVDAYEPARQPKGGRNRHDDVEENDAPPAVVASSSTTSTLDDAPRTPPSSLEDKLIAIVDMDNLVLPEIQHLPQRDPLYVLQNCVAVCPDIYQAQNRGLFSPEASKDLAPLVYMRKNPYTPRHPLDNESLRYCDANSRWLA